jgi:hypothetical protein
MTTRAAQFEILAAGVQYNADLVTAPYVKFFAAGTDDAKTAWDDKDKASAITKKALDTQGRAEVFGDGIYKLKFYTGDPDAEPPDTGVLLFEIDDYKVQTPMFSVVQKTGTYTATPDDDVILCNGTFTINLQDVANFEHPITIKNIGTGIVTVDPYSTQTIDGETTITIISENQIVVLTPDKISNIWRSTGYQSQGVYVNHQDGVVVVSTTTILLHSVLANTTWESIGPTGSGADNIWTALDNLPGDIDWIEVKLNTEITHTSATSSIVYAQKNQVSHFISDSYKLSHCNLVASGVQNDIVTQKIPVSSRKFDVYRNTGSGTIYLTLALTGYGYNP